MGESKKEILVEAIKKADDRVGLMDAGRAWYSGWKNKCTPESWAALNDLKKGDRVDIEWTTNAKGFNALEGFMKVIREGDVPAPTAPTSPQGDPRPVQQEWSPKQTCVKSATDIVVAQIGAGQPIENPIEEIMLKARQLYLDLKEAW